MSKTLTYLGEYTAGVVVGETRFEHGVPVDVDDDVAATLLDEYPAAFSTAESPTAGASKVAWETFRAAQGHDVSVDRTKQELIDLSDTPAEARS